MITKNSVVEIENLFVNHEPRPVKSNVRLFDVDLVYSIFKLK